ncbi:MAG: hypothetical protein GY906_40530 [bacterium]|nr:hypothetical protein [bacterium]
MNDTGSCRSPGEHKDRKTGLILFGILVILIGCLCLLLVPLMMISLAVTKSAPGVTAPDTGSIVTALVIYAVMGISFIWLGVGSIMARRWARTLLLIMSWLWLAVGVTSLCVMVFILPQALAQPQPSIESIPQAAQTIALFFAFTFLTIFFIVLPGILVFFYRSRHVKATCEANDPRIPWTDACPPAVLSFSLLMAFGAVGMLFMPVIYNPVFPLFGILLTGLPAGALWAVAVVVWLYAAWGLYKLKVEALWVTGGVLGFQTLSATVTFLRIEPIEMMRKMGYPEQQLEQIQQMGMFQGHWFLVTTIGSIVVLFGSLVYVRRYFNTPQKELATER